jgi:hypothetical protein
MVHDRVKHLKCDQCDYATNNNSLVQHVKTIHEKIKDIECPDPACEYRCSVSSSMRSHVNGVHRKTKDYQCPHCDKASHCIPRGKGTSMESMVFGTRNVPIVNMSVLDQRGWLNTSRLFITISERRNVHTVTTQPFSLHHCLATSGLCMVE